MANRPASCLGDANIRVLMVIEGEIATTQILEGLLVAARELGVDYCKVLLSELRFEHFTPDTVPLFVRCADPNLRRWIDFLTRSRHPYLYYLDDNFWELQGDSEVVRYYRDPEVRKTLDHVVSHASMV